MFRGVLAVLAPRASEVVVSIARLPATAGVLFGREAELGWLEACLRQKAQAPYAPRSVSRGESEKAS